MLKVLLVLLLSSNSFAEDCNPSLYQFRGQALCFSPSLKSYLTQDCSQKKCEALKLIDKTKTLELGSLPQADSRHLGAKICQALGGKTTVVSSLKTQDQICLCVAKDNSGVSCSHLALR